MINETTSSKLIYLVDFYYNYNGDVVSFYIVINDNDDMKNIRREIINKIEYKINSNIYDYLTFINDKSMIRTTKSLMRIEYAALDLLNSIKSDFIEKGTNSKYFSFKKINIERMEIN
jgi:hypothetical protein